jgi:hypothetical protein
MGAVGAGALLFSAWLEALFQPHHCRIKDWRCSQREGIQSTCLLGFLWVVTSPATTLVCLAQPAATPTNMPPLHAKRAMQGPTIQGVSQPRHATSVMLEATAVLSKQPAHFVMLAATIPPKEALPNLPAFLVMLEATAVLGRQTAHCVMLEATTLRKEALPNLPAFLVMLETITPRMEALPNLPAFLVMLEATTLSKEALPHPSAFLVMLEVTAVLGKQPAHFVMPAATIPPKEAQRALSVMPEAITLIQGPSSLPIAVPV